MAWAGWRRVRQAAQVASLGAFVYLFFATLQRQAAAGVANLFFRLDPLAGLGAMLASRSWVPQTALALVTLGLTLALGRVWCGWLCPLGTLLEWVRLRPRDPQSAAISPRWRTVKYWLLLLILAGALWGSLSLLVLDPLAILTRAATAAVLPALNLAVTALEAALYPVTFLAPALDGLEALLRGTILPVEPPVYSQNAVIGALFVGLFLLNALADRFWCRYLCPLGALLGLVAKVAPVKPALGPVCNRCGLCVEACRLGAVAPDHGYAIVAAECTMCLDCLAACPERSSGLHWPAPLDPPREYDPTRRQALVALAAGLAGVTALRTEVRAKARHPLLVRPPGVGDEGAFLARCLRCGLCLKTCPTSGLQPALTEAGLEGLWTPRLVSRLGYCDYGCNACGQVCPSGAIPALDLAAKREAVIGVASIDRSRCLPWAHGVPCIVCEEMCPRPNKAVRLEEATVPDDEGRPSLVQRPYVREGLCIGCGICEYRCPVAGEAAIRVYRP